MDEKKYFKFPVVPIIFFVANLSIIIWGLFYGRWQTAVVVFGTLMLLVLLAVSIQLLSWPVVKTEGLEIRSLLLPMFKKEFRYEEIQSVIFKRGARYEYLMTIIGSDGKRKYVGYMVCLPGGKLQEFLNDLRAHGVEVDNRMNYKDVV